VVADKGFQGKSHQTSFQRWLVTVHCCPGFWSPLPYTFMDHKLNLNFPLQSELWLWIQSNEFLYPKWGLSWPQSKVTHQSASREQQQQGLPTPDCLEPSWDLRINSLVVWRYRIFDNLYYTKNRCLWQDTGVLFICVLLSTMGTALVMGAALLSSCAHWLPLQSWYFLLSFSSQLLSPSLFLLCSAGEWKLGLAHARQALYHRAIFPAPPWFFETGFSLCGQTGIKFMILLPQPPECWEYRHVPPHLA
jgi:hypothetical protein